jgi:hypothetical protein
LQVSIDENKELLQKLAKKTQEADRLRGQVEKYITLNFLLTFRNDANYRKGENLERDNLREIEKLKEICDTLKEEKDQLIKDHNNTKQKAMATMAMFEKKMKVYIHTLFLQF